VVDPPPSRRSSHSSGSTHSDQTRRSRGSSVNIQLPAISLPTYDGNTCNWLQYRDTFEALVVNNAALTNVKKFHYLIASLKNEAKDLVSNLQITNENFAVVWQLITQRYNNKRFIAMLHTKNLCHLPQVKKGDAVLLRQLINHVSSKLNALQTLTLNVSLHDLILNQLILVTLDSERQKQWEMLITLRTDSLTTAELITYLEGRCRALELLQTLQTVKTTFTSHGSTHPTGNKVSKISNTYVATQVQCSLCNDSHRLFKCDKFLKMNPKQRISHVKQSRLCFNCLQPYARTQVLQKDVSKVQKEAPHTASL
jgi:hypothetical protein